MDKSLDYNKSVVWSVDHILQTDQWDYSISAIIDWSVVYNVIQTDTTVTL